MSLPGSVEHGLAAETAACALVTIALKRSAWRVEP